MTDGIRWLFWYNDLAMRAMFIERKTEQSDEAAVTAVFGVQGGRDLGGKSLMSKKYLYYFSEGNDAFGGDKVTMKNVLGGKGAGLAEMTAAGMPVPQGFTITTGGLHSVLCRWPSDQ